MANKQQAIIDQINITEIPAPSPSPSVTSVSDYNIGTADYESWYTGFSSCFFADLSKDGDKIRAYPIAIGKDVTVDGIGMRVKAAGDPASKAVIGIYSNKAGGMYPDALVLNAGEIGVDSVGVKTITISQALSAGIYWLVYIHNSATNVSFRSIGSDSVNTLMGMVNDLNSGWQMLQIAYTYTATLPSTFPSSVPPIAQQPQIIGLRFV